MARQGRKAFLKASSGIAGVDLSSLSSVDDADPGREEFGIMRRCERELKRRGINVYPKRSILLPNKGGASLADRAPRSTSNRTREPGAKAPACSRQRLRLSSQLPSSETAPPH